MTDGYAAVVLAGGAGRRMGGLDKPALPVGGRTMLDRVLAVVADAVPRVVVGPSRDGLPPDVVQTREVPPGGGPVAAAAAGVAVLPATVGLVAVLAADLPFLTVDAVGVLRSAVEQSTVDGAVLLDADGRAQLLCGVWRVAALRSAFAALGDPAGKSMRRLVDGLRVAEVVAATAAATGSGDSGATRPWYDCDNEDDLRRAEEWSR